MSTYAESFEGLQHVGLHVKFVVAFAHISVALLTV